MTDRAPGTDSAWLTGPSVAFGIEEDSRVGTRSVLSAQGELDLHVAPELRDRLETTIEEGAAVVVLDLSAVTFIDSMALGVLLGTSNHLRLKGGELRLVVPRPELRRIFEISLLDQVLALESTLEGALTSATER